MGKPMPGDPSVDVNAVWVAAQIRAFATRERCVNLDRKTLRTVRRDLHIALAYLDCYLDIRAQQASLGASSPQRAALEAEAQPVAGEVADGGPAKPAASAAAPECGAASEAAAPAVESGAVTQPAATGDAPVGA